MSISARSALLAATLAAGTGVGGCDAEPGRPDGGAAGAAAPAAGPPAAVRPEGSAGAGRRDDAGGEAEVAGVDRADPRPRFHARVQWSLPAKPEFVVAGDVDGDGDEDLLAVTQEGTLLLWRGGPGGLARPPETIAVGGYPLEPCIVPPSVGDSPTTSDTPLQVLVASRATGRIAHLDLTGATPVVEFRAETRWTPRALDVRASITAGPLLAVVGDGGTWLDPGDAAREVENPDVLPRCARWLAGERRLLAAGYQDTRTLHVVDGGGATVASIELGGIPRDLEEADLDGDGDLELVVAGGDDALWIFGWGRPGGAEAWLAEEGREPLVWRTDRVPIDVDATDLDGDGRAELLVTHYGGLSCALLSDFTAEGPRATWSAYVGQTARSACVVDVDGDGRRDLVVANRDALALSVLRGLPDLAFETAESVPVGAFPNELAVGDFDGDGRPDVVTVNAKDGTVTPLRNVDGALEALWPLQAAGPLTSPSFARSRDGSRDELYLLTPQTDGTPGTNLGRYYFHPEAATFGSETVETFIGRGVAKVVDFADGEPPDVVVTDQADPDAPAGESRGFEHFINTRAQSNVVSTWNGTFLRGTRAWAEIRFDNDPAPELVLVGGGPGDPRGFYVLDRRQAGLGKAAQVTTELYPLDAAAADVDGDGRDDVVLLCNDRWDGTDGFVQVFLRREGVEFEALPPVPTGLKPRHVAAGDLDGDGRADVVVAAQNSHVVNVWLSRDRGGATVLERLDDVGAGLGCLDVALADIDGDGALDLVVANAFTDDVSVIRVERP